MTGLFFEPGHVYFIHRRGRGDRREEHMQLFSALSATSAVKYSLVS